MYAFLLTSLLLLITPLPGRRMSILAGGGGGTGGMAVFEEGAVSVAVFPSCFYAPINPSQTKIPK